jgi:hypothetical protein
METTLSPRRPSILFGKRVVAATLLVLALAGLVAAPAVALPIGGIAPSGGGGIYVAPPDPCLPAPQILSFTATPATITLGQTATLTWNVQVPSGCNYLVALLGQSVGLQGSLPVQPLIDTSYTLTLSWGPTGALWTTATTTASVVGNQITISSQDMVPLFVNALGTPNITVNVTADLDLTGYGYIQIAKGVQLIGGRTAIPGTPYQPGPRLYTTTAAYPLFITDGENVRISGVRVEGPGSVPDYYTAAIWILPGPNVSTVSIEIDHNEIFNWNTEGVDIRDDNCKILAVLGTDGQCRMTMPPSSSSSGITYPQQSEPVWIHDNYFHDNWDQVPHFGYGVAVGHGARALIERNVFNAHIHAIAGDGTPRTGYRAYRNLVLDVGYSVPGDVSGEQQFDMHPRRDGDTSHAGNDIDIRYNAFLYKYGAAIDLRGTPDLRPIGYVVASNVFAHSSLSDAVCSGTTTGCGTGGSFLLEGNPCLGAGPSSSCGPLDNKVGVVVWDHAISCDFDGDGINDLFIATGETLWYISLDPSKGPAPWVYLNTSSKHLDELSLGYFSGGSVCDVVDGLSISVGGAGPWSPWFRNPVPLTSPSGSLSVSGGAAQQ